MSRTIPDFTDEQRIELRGLGLCTEQIEQLRIAMAGNRLWLDRPPAKNDVKELLADVEKLSRKLVRGLKAIAVQRDKVHGAAHNLLEVSYWKERPEDDGATAARHILPRLEALAVAAREAVRALPQGQTRAYAFLQPIADIDRALTEGWRKTHGTSVRTSESELNVPLPELFPKRLRPSWSSTSKFRKVCDICYAMACVEGANPERAIKNYMMQSNRRKKAMLEALDWGIKAATRKPRTRGQ